VLHRAASAVMLSDVHLAHQLTPLLHRLDHRHRLLSSMRWQYLHCCRWATIKTNLLVSARLDYLAQYHIRNVTLLTGMCTSTAGTDCMAPGRQHQPVLIITC
jgi:hypothetical protein